MLRHLPRIAFLKATIMNLNSKSCLLFVTASISIAAPAAAADNRLIPPKPRDGLESSATLYSGLFKASDGFTDRWVIGSYANVYRGGTGLHSDVVYVNREDNAFFGAFGLASVTLRVNS